VRSGFEAAASAGNDQGNAQNEESRTHSTSNAGADSLQLAHDDSLSEPTGN
jgi:hypothetical protein